MPRSFGERRLWSTTAEAGNVRTIMIPADGHGIAVELYDDEFPCPELHERIQAEFIEFCELIDRTKMNLS